MSPVVDDDVMFVGSWWTADLNAVDVNSGRRLWQHRAFGVGIAGAAVVVDDLVVFGTDAGQVIALDKSDGSTVWSSERLTRIESGLGTDGTRVYSAHVDGSIFALNVLDGSIAWRFRTDDAFVGGPAVADHTVYAVTDSGLTVALDAETGEALWRSSKDAWVQSAPAVAGNLLVVTSREGPVYALDATTGEEVWRFLARAGIRRSASIAGNAVYFGDEHGVVYSLEGSDGSLRWRFLTGDPIESTPAIHDGIVYIGSNDDSIYAIDAETGALAWSFKAGADVAASPSVHNDVVYIPAMDSRVYALVAGRPDGFEPGAPAVCLPAPDRSQPGSLSVFAAAAPLKPGTTRWSLNAGESIQSWFLIEEGATYLASGVGSIQRVDNATGNVLWTFAMSDPISARPALSDDLLIVGDEGSCVHAVDVLTGNTIWESALRAAPTGQIAAAGDRVYAALKTGDVLALALDDGTVVWDTPLTTRVRAGPTAGARAVFVTTNDSSVRAIDAATGSELWVGEVLRDASGPPVVAGSLVLVSSMDRRIYAFSAQSGALEWVFWAVGEDRLNAPVTVMDGSAFMGSDDGSVFSIDLLTGLLSWKAELGTSMESAVVAAGSLVYGLALDGVLHALDAETGASVWTAELSIDDGATLLAVEEDVFVHDGTSRIYRVVGGFADDFEPPEPPEPKPEYVPLSPQEVRDNIEFLTKDDFSQVRVEGQVTTAEGKSWTIIDYSDRATDVLRTAYYLLIGRTYDQDNIEIRYPTRSENLEIYGRHGLHYGGFCCEVTDTGLAVVVRGEFPLRWAIRASAHEVGHALQRLLNPAQMRAQGPLAGALWEAQAGSLEGAIFRTIGEYAGIDAVAFSNDRWARREIDDLRTRMRNSLRENPQGPSDRSSLIIWQAILNDPDLVHLRAELEENGKLSGSSYFELYTKLAMIPPSQVTSYIESITPDSVSSDLNYITSVLIKRIGRKPHPSFIALSEASLLLP